jgi:hypothetical protein
MQERAMKLNVFCKAAAKTIFAGPVLMFRLSEMFFASGHVIAYRSNRLAKTGGNPSARDKREVTLMMQEKIEGSIESISAIIKYTSDFFSNRVSKESLHLPYIVKSIKSVWESRSVTEMIASEIVLCAKIIILFISQPIQILLFFSNFIMRASDPLHSRVVENAKRMRKNK